MCHTFSLIIINVLFLALFGFLIDQKGKIDGLVLVFLLQGNRSRGGVFDNTSEAGMEKGDEDHI